MNDINNITESYFKQTLNNTVNSDKIPIGKKIYSYEPKLIKSPKYILYNHFTFNIKIHQEKNYGENHYAVVGFDIVPTSIDSNLRVNTDRSSLKNSNSNNTNNANNTNNPINTSSNDNTTITNNTVNTTIEINNNYIQPNSHNNDTSSLLVETTPIHINPFVNVDEHTQLQCHDRSDYYKNFNVGKQMLDFETTVLFTYDVVFEVNYINSYL